MLSVSIIISEIFDVQFYDLEGYPGSKFMVPIESQGRFHIGLRLTPIVVSVTVFEIFDIKAIFP